MSSVTCIFPRLSPSWCASSWTLAENGWPSKAAEHCVCCEGKAKIDDTYKAVPGSPPALHLTGRLGEGLRHLRGQRWLGQQSNWSWLEAWGSGKRTHLGVSGNEFQSLLFFISQWYNDIDFMTSLLDIRSKWSKFWKYPAFKGNGNSQK